MRNLQKKTEYKSQKLKLMEFPAMCKVLSKGKGLDYSFERINQGAFRWDQVPQLRTIFKKTLKSLDLTLVEPTKAVNCKTWNVSYGRYSFNLLLQVYYWMPCCGNKILFPGRRLKNFCMCTAAPDWGLPAGDLDCARFLTCGENHYMLTAVNAWRYYSDLLLNLQGSGTSMVLQPHFLFNAFSKYIEDCWRVTLPDLVSEGHSPTSF